MAKRCQQVGAREINSTRKGGKHLVIRFKFFTTMLRSQRSQLALSPDGKLYGQCISRPRVRPNRIYLRSRRRRGPRPMLNFIYPLAPSKQTEPPLIVGGIRGRPLLRRATTLMPTNHCLHGVPPLQLISDVLLLRIRTSWRQRFISGRIHRAVVA